MFIERPHAGISRFAAARPLQNEIGLWGFRCYKHVTLTGSQSVRAPIHRFHDKCQMRTPAINLGRQASPPCLPHFVFCRWEGQCAEKIWGTKLMSTPQVLMAFWCEARTAEAFCHFVNVSAVLSSGATSIHSTRA